MIAVFTAILPIFLLILVGQGLRRTTLFTTEFWRGLDMMCFFVLYPALLFVTIVRADFSALTLDAVAVALCASNVLIALATLLAWPILRAWAGVSRPGFSSVFQANVRWNGFIALTVAEKLFPPEGAAMVALVMALLIIPINIESVTVVAWFAGKSANIGQVVRKIAFNPLILAAAAALVARALPFALPDPAMQMFDLVGRAALGMGLLAVGAGLKPETVLRPEISVLLATVAKLLIYPAIVVPLALLLGLNGAQISYLALAAAVPSAMNGYVLARQMGGDAELYAAIVTVQTAISFVTIPVVLAVADQVSGG